jgi:hypothetical protein
MKKFKFTTWRILLGLAAFLAIYAAADIAMTRRRESQERAAYGGRTVHEWIELALKDSYWSAHWATLNPPEYANSAAEQKVIAIGAPAVPELANRLRGLHTGKVHNQLISWRVNYLSRWTHYPKFLDIPDDVSGDAALINYLLSRMGDAARPAVPAMLGSAEDLHAWAYYDLLDDFVRMGPTAQAALPELKRWSAQGSHDATRAVKYLERRKTQLELDDE